MVTIVIMPRSLDFLFLFCLNILYSITFTGWTFGFLYAYSPIFKCYSVFDVHIPTKMVKWNVLLHFDLLLFLCSYSVFQFTTHIICIGKPSTVIPSVIWTILWYILAISPSPAVLYALQESVHLLIYHGVKANGCAKSIGNVPAFRLNGVIYQCLLVSIKMLSFLLSCIALLLCSSQYECIFLLFAINWTIV